MILYHTSYIEIPHPDLQHSRPRLDFGIGFYLTSLRAQAERYGERFIRRGQKAIMNIYQFDNTNVDCTRKVFSAYDGEWLDFITACRKGLPHEQFDIVIFLLYLCTRNVFPMKREEWPPPRRV